MKIFILILGMINLSYASDISVNAGQFFTSGKFGCQSLGVKGEVAITGKSAEALYKTMVELPEEDHYSSYGLVKQSDTIHCFKRIDFYTKKANYRCSFILTSKGKFSNLQRIVPQVQQQQYYQNDDRSEAEQEQTQQRQQQAQQNQQPQCPLIMIPINRYLDMYKN